MEKFENLTWEKIKGGYSGWSNKCNLLILEEPNRITFSITNKSLNTWRPSVAAFEKFHPQYNQLHHLLSLLKNKEF